MTCPSLCSLDGHDNEKTDDSQIPTSLPQPPSYVVIHFHIIILSPLYWILITPSPQILILFYSIHYIWIEMSIIKHQFYPQLDITKLLISHG